MLDYGLERGKDILRFSLRELQAVSIEIDNINVDDALSYFGRQEDVKAVRDKMVDRFATGVYKDETGFEFFIKAAESEMIDAGLYESVTSGLGPRVVASLANLFTLPTQSWDWVGPDSVRNEEVTARMVAIREHGQFQEGITKADQIAVSVNTGPLMIASQGGTLRYMPFSPSCMYAMYHDEVYEEGQLRGVDYTDIEDATVVIVQVSQKRDSNVSNPNEAAFLAIFGRSEEYPNGRYVSYLATDYDEIPDVGNEKAYDYVGPDGNPANPLSLYANQNPDRYIPEYPFVIFRGGYDLTTDTLLPVTTSLWESCLEVDVAFSRLLKDSLRSARGTTVFRNPDGDPLPPSLEGDVVMSGDNQTMEFLGRDASNSVSALNVVRQLARSVAEGFSVPGYQVMSETTSIPESGVALTIRTQPLIDFRDRRVEMNKSAVRRLFEIEKALIAFHGLDEPISEDVSQVWIPGRYIIPEAKIDRVNRLSIALDKDLIDYVRAVRDYHDFSTDEEAMGFIDMMEERKADYPKPSEERAKELQSSGGFFGDSGEEVDDDA